jgi:hypothetical protein
MTRTRQQSAGGAGLVEAVEGNRLQQRGRGVSRAVASGGSVVAGRKECRRGYRARGDLNEVGDGWVGGWVARW